MFPANSSPAAAWQHAKIAVEDFFMIPRDWLHVPIGILIFALVATVLIRLRHGPSLAWAATLLLELVNEAFDAAYAGSMNFAEASKDVLATMAVPTILLIVLQVRARRRLPTRP